MTTLKTERTTLRPWRDEDLDPFAALNADAEVMRHFPSVLTRAESDAFVERVTSKFERTGWGPWALEVNGRFVGFAGLWAPTFSAHFTPCVEVGWRLERRSWGHGYATEAAKAAVQFGFKQLGLNEIVSFTVPLNLRSRKVMERLGMQREPADDFNHPRLPTGHPMQQHVLYRLKNPGVR